MSPSDTPDRYSEEMVKQILTRAMELEEAQAETISEQDLRLIGRELGIRSVTLEAATREVRERETGAVAGPGQVPVAPHWSVTVLTLIGGGVVGLLARGSWYFLPPGTGVFVSVGAMLVLQSAAVAVSTLYRGIARHERFQVANIALWGGFATGWLFLNHGFAPGYFWPTVLPFATISALAGGAVIAIRDRIEAFRQSRSNAAAGSAPPFTSGTAQGSVLKRIVEDIRNVFRSREAAPEEKPDNQEAKPNYA